MRNQKPMTNGELIELLQKLPAGDVPKLMRYAEDFDINQDSSVIHLTGVSDTGFMQFGYTELFYSISHDDEFDNEFADDAVEPYEAPPVLIAGRPDWEWELLAG